MKGKQLGRIKVRAMRQWVGWPAVYRIEGRGDTTWSRCRFVDVSEGGAGLELFGPLPRVIGDRVDVTLQSDDPSSADVRLVGAVTRIGDLRHPADADTGTMVGIEVVAWTSGARALVSSALTMPRSA